MDDSSSSLNASFLSDPSSSSTPRAEDDDDYLPPSISHAPKNSLRSTITSYVCVTVGAGIISLPYGVASTGWTGVLLIALASLVCVQTANWLILCLHHSPTHPLTTYEAVGVAALGRPGRVLVSVLQNLTLFGVCCIFLIIAGGNLSSVLPALSLHAWVLVLGAVLVPVSWLKTVKEIKPLAWAGFAASVLVGLVVVVTGLHTYATSPPPSTAYHALRLSGLPTAVNVIVFSLGAHSVIPNQVTEMHHALRDHQRFTGLSYLLIGSIYCLVAACGYAGYASTVHDNVLQSIDAPDASHGTHVLAQSARALISLHVLLAYPLPLNPVSLAAEEQLGISALSEKAQVVPRVALRSGLVLASVFVASVVPYFGAILSLVSALSVIATAFVLPPLFYYLLYREKGVIGGVEKVKLVGVLVVGLVSVVIGLYYAVTGLVEDIANNPNPFDNYWG